MKKFMVFLIAFMLISFSGCNWKVEIVNPDDRITESETDINKEPEPETPFVPDEGNEADSSEKNDPTDSDSGNTYYLKISEPDFGAEISYIDYINIVNDRLYASSRNSQDGIFSADFNGENGCILENCKDSPGYDIDNICSAGGTDIFILKKYVPEKSPWELWHIAVKTDAEGNYIEKYPLAEIENGTPFGYDIIIDRSGNFYLWDYWGRVLVFRNDFSESYLIDRSGESNFEKVIPLSNGTTLITTDDGAFVFDHENKSFGDKIELPPVFVFAGSGNSEFDFICHDYENLYGYVFEENRLEKLISFEERGIHTDFLHSADIDENGNITVITKEIFRYGPNIFKIFYFEKEN